MDDCLFCKLVSGKIPSRKVYEDDEILAFHDINLVAPVHFLMVPKVHVASMAECGPERAPVLGRMMAMAGGEGHGAVDPDGRRQRRRLDHRRPQRPGRQSRHGPPALSRP